ncbi:hypothetical protein RYX36_020629, partial [Vicia faba]
IQKGQDKKRLIDPEFKIGGQRNWIQVLSNSGIASVLVVSLWVLTEGEDYCLNSKDSPLITAIIGGVIGHYCCCNGDTWSSEIGVLSDDRPRLIITFKNVRKGINDGLGGSIINSLFGATLLFSGFCSILQKVVGKPEPTVKKISVSTLLHQTPASSLWVLTEGKDYCLNSKDSPLITAIIGGVIGHYCCCNGDTWSSEIGVLSDDRPRLITTFKHVRKGINGGVTKTGLLAAAELLTTRCGSDRVLKKLLVIPIATTEGL